MSVQHNSFIEFINELWGYQALVTIIHTKVYNLLLFSYPQKVRLVLLLRLSLVKCNFIFIIKIFMVKSYKS